MTKQSNQEKARQRKAELDAMPKWKQNLYALGGLAIVIFLGWFFTRNTFSHSEQAAVAKPEATALQVADQKIDQAAVMAMDRANFPKFYNTLGEARFSEANELAKWAARAAAQSDSCDRVTMVGQSEKTTKSSLIWYVDCANSERFMISEDQARAARGKLEPAAGDADKKLAASMGVPEPKSARWKAFNEPLAISVCDEMVKSTMVSQRSFRPAWRWDTSRDEETGLVTFERDFEAKNALGVALSGRYRCVVNADRGRIERLLLRDLNGWKKLI